MKTNRKSFAARAAALALALVCALSAACAATYINQDPPASWADKDVLKLTAIPIPYNDAALLEVGGRSMLIDGGFCGRCEDLRNELTRLGYPDHVNIFFNTHPHDDHIGAVAYMVRYGWMTADAFVSSFPRTFPDEDGWQETTVGYLDAAGIPYIRLKNGTAMDFGGAQLDFFWSTKGGDINSRSCQLKITFGERSVLMMADATKVAMEDFNKNLSPEMLKADILKYPHHGYIAMPGDLLKKIAPDYAYITNKQSGTPDANKQLKQRKIPFNHTTVGPIVMVTDGVDWYIRQTEGALW